MKIDKPLSELLSHVDHTLLSPTATWEDIRAAIEDGIAFSTASVCLPPSYVKRAGEFAKGLIPICTVIGFPNGYSSPAAKCFEAADAVKNGADELDMVIDLGALKDRRYDALLSEINAVKEACDGRILKVIIETCLLTEEEKIRMCEIISASGADYVKTSTGFSSGGATREDIRLFATHIKGKKIKAAGGIASLQDAEDFLSLGADRLGTSRIVNLVKTLL